MIAQYNKDEEYKFFYKDHLGIIRQLDNSSQQNDYFPYGEERLKAGNETDYKFSGKELDSGIGLHYFGSRYYSSLIGRWLVPDPAGQGFSPYTYCALSPANYVDPDGRLFVVDDLLIAMTIGAAFNSMMNAGNIHDFGDFAKYAGIGALSGAIGYGLSPGVLFNSVPVGAIEGFGYGALTGGLTGGITSSLNAGSINAFGSGALAGGVTGGLIGGYQGYKLADAMGQNPWTGKAFTAAEMDYRNHIRQIED